MYNANANLAEVGGHGSTRLHMDIADALNVMMYAARDPAGAEGCAAWEIFRVQDSTKLREFLRSNYTMEVPEPIHSQEVYFDDGACGQSTGCKATVFISGPGRRYSYQRAARTRSVFSWT
jgi:lysine-specific demethylase 3